MAKPGAWPQLVICSGMIRSGSTLQYQLARAVLASTGPARGLGFMDSSELAGYSAAGSTRAVVKTHRWQDELEPLLSDPGTRVLYVFRDIRDVACSLMQKDEKPLQVLIDNGVLEGAIQQYHRWTTLEGVHVARYESMITDLRAETSAVAASLGISLSHEDAGNIAATLAPDAQQQRIRASIDGGATVTRGDAEYDPESLLHVNHLQDGLAGKYQTQLSRSEANMLTRRFADWLTEAGYDTRPA